MATIPETSSPARQPPREQVDVLRWVRQNLFNTWYNSLLTVLGGWLIYTLVSTVLTWAFTWAEWGVVTANLRLLMIGTYPVDQVWRVWLCVALAAILLGLSQGLWPDVMGSIGVSYGVSLLALALLPLELSNRLWLILCGGLIFGGWWAGQRMAASKAVGHYMRRVAGGWIGLLFVVVALLRGIEPLLPVITTRQWGGLLLTFVLAISSMLLSFPFGVLLAIGRRDGWPAIRVFCTIYIELFRGLPLVTVLFMFLIMLTLFVPGGEGVDNVIKAIVGYTLFTSAYIAENVRGGLQSIPRGQYEAARALGLNPIWTMTFIILPQALRIVIPSNVNQFVSLFKDTTLVVVAGGGMRELLGISRSIVSQGEFLGKWFEALVFAAIIYWFFCFSMTYVSRRLETKFHSGRR